MTAGEVIAHQVGAAMHRDGVGLTRAMETPAIAVATFFDARATDARATMGEGLWRYWVGRGWTEADGGGD